MDMVNEIFNDLYKLVWPGTILLCLWCYFITLGLRRIIERLWKGAKENWWWNEVILYFLPMAIGAATSFPIKPLLPLILTKPSAVFIWGAVSGALSAFVYGRAQAIINRKLTDMGVNVQLPDGSAVVVPVADGTVVKVTPKLAPDPDKVIPLPKPELDDKT